MYTTRYSCSLNIIEIKGFALNAFLSAPGPVNWISSQYTFCILKCRKKRRGVSFIPCEMIMLNVFTMMFQCTATI